MSTSKDYIEYVYDQLKQFSQVRYRKMFGEYMVYIDEKPALLVCDNQVFIKKIDQLAEQLADLDEGYPYDGAKLHYMLNIDQIEQSTSVINLVLPYLKTKRQT